MGLPLLGESHHFFSPNTSSDIPPFIKERIKRYGPLFKTSLVGRPVVVSTDPEFNHYIFQQEGKLFQSWYPDTFTEIFGRENVGSLHGFIYKYLKSLVLRLVGPESLKEKLLCEMEEKAWRCLESWSNQPSVDLKEAIATMIFDLTAKKLISYDPNESSEDLRLNFVAFMQGLISFPVNIPGTAYNKCLQGRKKAMKMLKRMLDERRASAPRKNGQSDFFDYVVEELMKERSLLTEAIALDLMFVLLFATFETTSLALTMAIKILTDHPAELKILMGRTVIKVVHVLQNEDKEEHEAIVRNRENPNSGMTWKEYKSMTYTNQVINETVRLANIVPGIFRKALTDIHVKGYTIPAGWSVVVCPPAVHLNPEIYEDPLAFKPSRWDGIDTNGGSKNFMAFGGGMRFCVGTDFAKLQMAVFLHCLLTKYRWTKIKGGNIIRTPGLQFPEGYHVLLSLKSPNAFDNWKELIK
ncbi:Cytochrome P450 87A3 [Acorus calamus]|uniref:Cytochrome P450 87A3 n=1 Tax=Acorus calamus TaxID=4465 RepID=A0AAV9DVE6_ACOCL|nr:Cytochrome P450 87A3 [Acorus calamus]